MRKYLFVFFLTVVFIYPNRYMPINLDGNDVVVMEAEEEQTKDSALEEDDLIKNVDFAIDVEDYDYAEKLVRQEIEEKGEKDYLNNKLAVVMTAGGKYKESYELLRKILIEKTDEETEEIIFNTKYPELFVCQIENLEKLMETENLNWRKALYEKSYFIYYEKYLELIEYKNSDEIYKLGNVYMQKEKFQKAMEIFEKDKNKDERNIFGTAVTSRFLGFYEKAITYYDDFIKLEPEMPEAYLGIAQAYQMNTNYEKAISYYKRYLKYEKDELVYIVMANIEISRDKYGDARSILEEGQREFPDSSEIGELLIEVYSKLGG